MAGAWAGFLAGAVVGVAIDAIAGTGIWVAIFGHVAAVPGAMLANRVAARST